MLWLRSWPDTIPLNRSHVVDNLPRLVMRDFDYTPLGGIHEDICMLEWDVALDREGMELFQRQALTRPKQVTVAPYRLYFLSGPVWCHRRILDQPINSWSTTSFTRWVDTDETHCDYFSFGCIYLPHALVAQFLDAETPARGRSPLLSPDAPYADDRLHDQTFSVWHRHFSGQPAEVQITWDVHPQHLHF